MIALGKNNRFYIIVHADEAEKDMIKRKDIRFLQTLEEISDIKLRFDYKILSGELPPETLIKGIPKNKLIYVCGFFKDIGVKAQYETLEKNSYHAIISDYGTYDLNEHSISK